MAKVDRKTGEILSVFSEIRTQAWPGDFSDAEGAFPPSVVDSSEYEPLGDLVAKLTRGGTASISSRTPVFEVAEGIDPMEAIRNFDETRREGFDLADAASIARKVKEVAEQDVEERKKKLAEEAERLKQDEKDLKAFREKEKALKKAAAEAAAPPPAE